jgi:hypothetical protein
MIFRDIYGYIIIINKNDFKSDKEYYMKIISRTKVINNPDLLPIVNYSTYIINQIIL